MKNGENYFSVRTHNDEMREQNYDENEERRKERMMLQSEWRMNNGNFSALSKIENK